MWGLLLPMHQRYQHLLVTAGSVCLIAVEHWMSTSPSKVERQSTPKNLHVVRRFHINVSIPFLEYMRARLLSGKATVVVDDKITARKILLTIMLHAAEAHTYRYLW